MVATLTRTPWSPAHRAQCVEPPDDLVRRIEARGYHRGFDDGFDHGVAVGSALGRRLEALRRAAELGRWRRLVRWTARQPTLGER